MQARVFTRLSELLKGWGALTIVNFIYDNMLYPFMIYKCGTLIGGSIMTAGSIISCAALIMWYEHKKTDWLGVNIVEDIKQNGSTWVSKLNMWTSNSSTFLMRILRMSIWCILYIPSRMFLVTLWALKKNDAVAFIVLSVFQDPFITTTFLRHGQFDGLRKKDWVVFTGSSIVSNGYWIARNVLLIELFRHTFHIA